MSQKLQAVFTHKHTYLAMLVAVLIADFGEAWFIPKMIVNAKGRLSLMDNHSGKLGVTK